MGAFYLAVAIIVLAVIAFVIGRNKALAGVSGNIRELHSLPGYYGHYTAIWCAVPALMIVAVWAVFEGTIISALVQSALPEEVVSRTADRMSLFMLSLIHI